MPFQSVLTAGQLEQPEIFARNPFELMSGLEQRAVIRGEPLEALKIWASTKRILFVESRLQQCLENVLYQKVIFMYKA